MLKEAEKKIKTLTTLRSSATNADGDVRLRDLDSPLNQRSTNTGNEMLSAEDTARAKPVSHTTQPPAFMEQSPSTSTYGVLYSKIPSFSSRSLCIIVHTGDTHNIFRMVEAHKTQGRHHGYGELNRRI